MQIDLSEYHDWNVKMMLLHVVLKPVVFGADEVVRIEGVEELEIRI